MAPLPSSGDFAILIIELLIGLALVAVVLFDVFETVVVPRRTTSRMRFSPHILPRLWPIWRMIGTRLKPAWRREEFLGTFAPFAFVFLLLVWVLALICGFGLALHALADDIHPPIDGYATALYLAGVSLLTIGFGDFVPTALASRAIVLLAGASGLAVVALVISLMFNLYASFARREVLVLLLDSRAGVPPSGVMLLETFGRFRTVDELAATFASYEVWTAEMLDSHLAYPILPYFRSSHDSQSWVSALGAVLDAATLFVCAVPKDPTEGDSYWHNCRASAEMMYAIGCHALVDLTQAGLVRNQINRLNTQPGIERAEFEAACHRLTEAGYRTICTEESWQAFSQRRAVYSQRLNLLARYFASPPTQWIGDRTVLAYHQVEHIDH